MDGRAGMLSAGCRRGRRSLARGRAMGDGELAGDGNGRQLELCVFELSLPAAGVVAEILVEHAIRQVVGTRRLGLHAGMIPVMALHF